MQQVIHHKLGPDKDISLVIGKIALAITNINQRVILNPQILELNMAQKDPGFLQEKTENIKNEVFTTLGLQDRNSYVGTLALEDSILFMIHLRINHAAILNKDELDLQCFEAARNGEAYRLWMKPQKKGNSRGSCVCQLF